MSEIGLSYNSKNLGSCVVLELSGEIRGQNLGFLREEVKNIAQTGKAYIIFDLFNVTFVDSMGLGFFVRVLDQVRSNGGGMAICRVDFTLERILSLIRLPIVETLEEAIERLENGGERS